MDIATELIQRIESISHNRRYSIHTRQKCLEDVKAIIEARLVDLELESDQTQELFDSDEIH